MIRGIGCRTVIRQDRSVLIDDRKIHHGAIFGMTGFQAKPHHKPCTIPSMQRKLSFDRVPTSSVSSACVYRLALASYKLNEGDERQ